MIQFINRTFFRYSTRATLFACLLLPAADSRAQASQLSASTAIASQPAQPAPLHIESVFHVVGLEEKPGGTGNLEFSKSDMTLHLRDHSNAVPLRSILAFSIAHDDRALMSGTKGKLAEAVPYGVGFAVTMTRPQAETLTLFYKDANDAIHGCVLVLPKGTEEGVVSALSSVGLSETYYPKTGSLTPSEPQHEPRSQVAPASGPNKPSVEVTLPSESIDGIPSAFPAAVYEQVIEQLTQSGLFAHVWREGDIHRTPDALVLHLDIENWKKGSARGRGFGPFTGATTIKSRVTLVDASGRTVFQGEVDGAKRMKGENLDATNSLAKHVRKALEKNTHNLQSNNQEGK